MVLELAASAGNFQLCWLSVGGFSQDIKTRRRARPLFATIEHKKGRREDTLIIQNWVPCHFTAQACGSRILDLCPPL